VIALPPPRLTGRASVEAALRRRRSVRRFRKATLTLAEVGQLLWAAQGVTGREGERTSPSAGATYPLELYLAAGEVEGLAPGLFWYLPEAHSLDRLSEGDPRRRLRRICLDQRCVGSAAAALVIAADYRRTEARYGARARRYVHIEAGHAAENAHLQAEAMGLGAVVVGAFEDRDLAAVLGLPRGEHPLVVLPVGRPRGRR
jgi:SagB-type dehydrogenase family enzyme